MSGERYRQTYRFGPLERRGIAGGLRPGQLLVIGSACLFAVAIFRRMPTPGGLAVAVLAVVVASVACWLPIGGRQIDEWCPVVLSWLLLTASGGRRYRSPAPGNGVLVELGNRALRRERALPPTLDGVDLLAIPLADGREVGLFHARRVDTYTAVLVIRVRSFGLLAAADQERRLVRWGRLLASLARDGGTIRRLQVLERTVPHDEDQLRRWLESNGDASLPETSPVRQSYDALLQAAGDVTQDHEVLVAVQVEPRRARTGTARGGGPKERAIGIVARDVRSLADRLDGSEAGVVGLYSAGDCARLVRLSFEPYSRKHVGVLPSAPGASLDGPTATEVMWDRYRTGGAVHRTYWVAQWPRLAVGPAFLGSLLLTQSAVRSFSVVVEPVSPARARSAVEAAITSDEADDELRRERGFRTSARRRSQQTATRRREEELAEGHEELRFAGYLTVTARDDDELERSCDEVVQAAQQAYLDLQPMWGQQDTGFVAGALPLCDGLGRGRMLS